MQQPREQLANHHGEYARSLADFYQNQIAGHSVYANNRIQSRVAALDQHFPATRKMLGSKTFLVLAQVYSQHYESQQWDINLYGENLPSLLSAQKHSSKREHYDWDYIAWLAGLEYELLKLYYSDSAGQNTIRIEYPCHVLATSDKVIRALQIIDQCHAWLQMTKSVIGCPTPLDIRAVVATRQLDDAGFLCTLSLKTENSPANI